MKAKFTFLLLSVLPLTSIAQNKVVVVPLAEDSASPTIINEVIARCPSSSNLENGLSRIGEGLSFTKARKDSIIEAHYSGRIYIEESGQLRLVVDMRANDGIEPSSNNTAIISDANKITRFAITSYFEGLPAGEHTVSFYGNNLNVDSVELVIIDPGCFGSHSSLLIKEIGG